MSSPQQPLKIGILDSGVGGLSVLNAIRTELPNIAIDYVADSAWCPYGNKQPELIRERVFSLTDRLLAQGCSLIIVACNSATIHAVEALRAHYPIPFVGMEPAVKPAASLTQTGVVGVLATEASLAGEKFHRLVNEHGDGVRIITRPCPSFVDLVESGTLHGTSVQQAVQAYTDEMIQENADVLVLGCTHYPFLKESIQQVVGSEITIIDTGPAVAKRVLSIVQEELSNENGDSTSIINIATTGDADHLKNILPKLCPNLKVTILQW